MKKELVEKLLEISEEISKENMKSVKYIEFLKEKIAIAPETGFDADVPLINFKDGTQLKPHQRDAVRWAIKGGRRALFESFGLGKCHGKGTKILMSDCSVKNVEDIKAGEAIMGDDGAPRNVLSLARGCENMYRITMKNGDSFTCNESHILAFVMSNKHNGHRKGDKVCMSVREFFKLPDYAKRNCYKLYKVALEFQKKETEFDPYLYGVWLGDGTCNHLDFTINDTDSEIVDYITNWANTNMLEIRILQGRGCKTYCLHKGVKNNQKYHEKEFLKTSSCNGKRIDKQFLINDSETRLQVLAGIIDTDGHLVDNCFEVATKWEGLRDDILFLCRSLGFSVAHKEKFVNGKKYYRIYISGYTEKIPCITRKKASARKQIKNPLVYGFDVEYLGADDYYGFEIDGNHLYLLSDFTVTHNTVQQLIICNEIIKIEKGKALIVCPLGVKQEFIRDAKNKLGIDVSYVKTQEEVDAQPVGSIVLTNYERVRDGNIEPKKFLVTCLDEASVLRSFGSKTYQTFLDKFKGVQFKFVATATPSPNKYKELIHYAGYLEIMDTGQALTRFFQRDSTKANQLTLYPHKEREFWFWMSSWALFITSPADLGYDDTGYALPAMNIVYHCVDVDHSTAPTERDGQTKMFRDAALGLSDASKEKTASLPSRVAKMKEIIDADPESHYIVWHDLEKERHAVMSALKEYDVAEVYGSQDMEVRERNIIDFSEGRRQILATKPSLSGQGCNFQYHCHKAIFLGIGYEFNDFIQSIHRIYRFLQQNQVEIHIIYAESEGEILKALQKKWTQHNYLLEQMSGIIKEYGLDSTNKHDKLMRTLGLIRQEKAGKFYRAINNDCVLETLDMPDSSVHLIHTSIPFGNHYEYCASYNDMGHKEDNARFFAQMDFLTPELLLVLQPGRLAVIHVKDRILFGNTTGTGMPTVDPFSDLTVMHYIKHGFQYMGRITIETDVVRENNQTYRLGWTEKCKDGSKMGVGCPEYLLLFRKLPTDTSNAYADVPVAKSKKEYSRGRWQIDARAKWNSSGNRFLSSDEIKGLPVEQVNRYFAAFAENSTYNYDEHVNVAKILEDKNALPATFETLRYPARTAWVWSDVNRMLTLNSSQRKKNLTQHLCPLQFDIVNRVIENWSNKGETVFDPFGGIMTVPYCAIKLGRRGIATELNPEYWRDGLKYLEAAEIDVSIPTLFDIDDLTA